MSEVFTAKANDTISTTLREIGHISMERDIRPAMRRAMDLVERNLKARISENSKGYNLDRHAQRGVKSKPWTVSSNSKTFGFTTFLVAREWLYIFNEGTYITGVRKTKKAYKTGAYTDRLGRHVPERHYKPGVSRGSIPALKYMDATRASVEGGIFSILRHDIERAVNQRLQNAL